jgi:hypothetical protein
VSIEELKRENEILKDALCMEQDRLSHARHHLQNAQDRIKRLEEAGDLMVQHFYTDEPRSEMWEKAKEAKP